ncbi:flavocytochrome c [Alkalibaculum sp. M08DMB]|uniref:Urocanate reductase n=1 Tax=Alkalibaculum sporogenes TaxID=2655001 RepID=A0A6A7K7G9_9FIRM|nr:flavocytochrome c [Alkalibaculum sporogenes]MPW25448.1 flavocytochrome c [Alkalibaculum sporogenes]
MFRKKNSVIICLILCFAMTFMVACSGGNSEASFKAGTYTAEEKGNSDTIKVEVTFSETEITDINIVSQAETPGLGDVAIEKIKEDILSGQTLGVDEVSGATYSSVAFLAAVIDCVEQAGGDVEALKNKKADSSKGKAIEKTADVIVVGGGGAGLAAAVSAAENGASVILIEKSIALGGNTLRSGGGYNTYDPERQESIEMNDTLLKELKGYLEADPKEYGDFAPTFEVLQGQIEDYIKSGDTSLFDSAELHAIHTYIGGKRTDLEGNEITVDYELVKTYTSNTLPTLNWLEDIGVGIRDDVSTILGALWPRSHMGDKHLGTTFLDPLEKKAVELGAEIMLETSGEELIEKDGKVVGVKATKSDGTSVTLNASKGVVMATGGFGENPEMRQKYNVYWPEMPLTMKSTNTPNATGDGIVMGEKVGANLVGMGFIQLMPSSHPETGALSGGVWGSAETQVFVNKEGKRFVNEYSERDVLAKAALLQEDQLFYIICDENTAGITPDGKNIWGDNIEDLIANKSIYKADTLENLAKQLGMSDDALVKEIDKYNGFSEKENDPEFGKSNFGAKIETGPFYATPRSPSVHHTMGGLAIDTSARVLDENNKPISGLYAAGEVTGGIHAGNRLGGNAISDIMTFGKISGESAAKQK